MIAVAAWVAGIASGWLIIAGLLGTLIGRSIRLADEREGVRP